MLTPIALKPLSSSDLSLVNDNFQNIYPTFFQPSPQETLLVPALWGDHIYHARTGLVGRCLSVFYQVIQFFAGDSFRARRFQEVVQKTHLAFKKLEADLIPHLKAYEKYLSKKSTIGHIKDEKRIDFSRREIRRFYASTSPYVRLFRRAYSNERRFQPQNKIEEAKKVEERVRLFSQKFLSKGAEGYSGPFFDLQQSAEVDSYIHLIRAEGQIQEPLPLKPLKLISAYGREQEVADDPNSELSQVRHWGQKLNNLGNKLDIRNFHNALSALARFFQKKCRESDAPEPKAVRIEQELVHGGFKGFHQVDKKHEAWRKGLYEGMEFYYEEKGKPVKAYLGKPLSGKLDEDKNLVFEVKDAKNQVDSCFVLKIGLNLADLEIRDKERKEAEFGIESAAMVYLDPKGRFALMEKLSEPLTNKKWKTTKGALANDDKAAAEKIKKWVEWFLDKDQTPNNLDIRFLMFNKKGQLKTLKGCLPEKFNVMALENLVYAYANGSLAAYTYMIQPLTVHPKFVQYLTFFRIVIENALKTDPTPVGKLGTLQVPEITDHGIIEHCKQLHEKVVELKKSCMGRIVAKYRVKNANEFHKKLKNKILEYYGNPKPKTFGRLWDTLTPENLEKTMEKAAKNFLEKK